jgi:SAM-dependent methyltransferase
LPEAPSGHDRLIVHEFGRTAAVFAERTRGRFEDMDVVGFSRVQPTDTVVEVGAGTGNFLSLFAGAAASLVAVDLTPAMLAQASVDHRGLHLVVGDGRRLPLRSGTVDLVCSAQVLHHVTEPVAFVSEMRRVAAPAGRVLIVDQVATERFEEALAMNELEKLRDPSHAAARPPSAFRVMLAAVGLEIADERIVSSVERVSTWMWPKEFPASRIEAVREFIARRGAETGMNFERDADDWTFERRRIMLLAEKGAA